MNCRDQIIYATLLHDIGKFMQRAELPCPGLTDDASKQRVCPQDKQSAGFTHLHTLWTDQFFEEHGSLFPDLTERFTNAEDNLTNLAAWHHVPSTPAQWIVTEAERMSSGMDRKARDEEDEIGPGAYKSTPLRSLFARLDLRLDRGPLPEDRWEYPLKPLKPEKVAVFPMLRSGEPKSLVEDYKTLWTQFESELKNLSKLRTQPSLFFNRLLWLWQKYSWCVPASTIDLPDISLYDHSRTAAGIAACLYDYHRATNTFDDHAIKTRETEKFRILAGDLSGIQRALFAFAPTRSKGAAKTLRARSFYLSMLGEAVIQFVLDRLNAHPTQVFMNAGGRFLVLLPNLPELGPQLNEIRQISDLWCRDQFNGLLTLNLDWSVTLRSWDFCLGEHQPYAPERKTFATVLEQVAQGLEQQKKRKLAAVLIRNGKWSENAEFLLSGRYQGYQNGKCEACGEEPAADVNEDDDMKIGTNCRMMRSLGRKLVEDPVIVWDKHNPEISFFEGRLGIGLITGERLIGVGERIEELNGDHQGFGCRFMANHVPRLNEGQKERLQGRCDEEELSDLKIGSVLSFGSIAAQARHQNGDVD